MPGKFSFKKNGDVVHDATGTLIGHWRKVPDDFYASGTFRTWLAGQSIDDGRNFYPRHLSGKMFDPVVEALEAEQTKTSGRE